MLLFRVQRADGEVMLVSRLDVFPADVHRDSDFKWYASQFRHRQSHLPEVVKYQWSHPRTLASLAKQLPRSVLFHADEKITCNQMFRANVAFKGFGNWLLHQLTTHGPHLVTFTEEHPADDASAAVQVKVRLSRVNSGSENLSFLCDIACSCPECTFDIDHEFHGFNFIQCTVTARSNRVESSEYPRNHSRKYSFVADLCWHASL